MAWPSTDFEASVDGELRALRLLARNVGKLIEANDGKGRPDIAWRNVKAAWLEWQAGDRADV